MRLCKIIEKVLGSSEQNRTVLEQICTEFRRINATLATISEADQERLVLDRTVAKEKLEYLKASGDLIRLEVSATKARVAMKPGIHDNEF